jgi:prepilin-type N-terminal cleavage/methylation domain-containing protein
MARKSSNFSLLRLYLVLQRSKPAGFTLLELLVALVIGSIITFLLLFTVIELLRTNQREAARSDTQRDVQAALDYIARDLREAVYVYDPNCFIGDGTPGPNNDRCPGLTSTGILPTPWSANQANSTPVLAFWRVDDLPAEILNYCETRIAAFGDATPSQADVDAVAGIACISKRAYTLVIYSIQTKTASDKIWKGRARLTRYELPQFPANQTAGTVTRTNGWGSPVQDGGGFLTWPFTTKGNTQISSPTEGATPSVLVDFMHDSTITAANVKCPSGSATFPYVKPISDVRAGFYACVSGAEKSTQNQEVALYMQGNAAGRSGIITDVIIPLETRVMTRGALQKGGT